MTSSILLAAGATPGLAAIGLAAGIFPAIGCFYRASLLQKATVELNRREAQIAYAEKEAERHARKARQLELLDGVSKVLNRQAFFETVDGFRKIDSVGMVMVVRLNGLRDINRRFGYRTADQALSRVSFALAQAVRDEDYIGRLGNGEFGIYLVGALEADAVSIARRIGQHIAMIKFHPQGGERYGLSVRIGAAGTVNKEPSALLYDRAERQANSDAFINCEPGRLTVPVPPMTTPEGANNGERRRRMADQAVGSIPAR